MATTRRGFFGLAAGAIAACVGAVKLSPVLWKSKLWASPTPDIAPVEYGGGFAVMEPIEVHCVQVAQRLKVGEWVYLDNAGNYSGRANAGDEPIGIVVGRGTILLRG